MKPGRNDPCICGSGRKYKHCCQRKASSPTVAPLPAELSRLTALYDSGHYGELESGARSLVEQHPRSATGWMLLSAALVNQGKNALHAFQMTAELLPDDAEVLSNLGNAQKDLGLLDDAVATFRRALAKNQNFALAHYNLGVVMSRLGQLDDAVASYRRALALDPNLSEAHNNLGNSLKDLCLPDDAIASYRRALRINPGYAHAYSNLLLTLNYRAEL